MMLPGMAFLFVFNYMPMYGAVISFKDFMVKKGILASPWADPWYKYFMQFFNSPYCGRLIRNWNTFMSALLYVTRQDLQPLQVVLYNIISGAEQQIEAAEYDAPTETLKMAAVVLTALPIIIVYPFIQKYFTSGMLVGAIKG